MNEGRCNVYWSCHLSILIFLIHTPRTERCYMRSHNRFNRTGVYSYWSNSKLGISNLIWAFSLSHLQMRMKLEDVLDVPLRYCVILFSSGKYIDISIEYGFKIKCDCISLSLWIFTVGTYMSIKRNYSNLGSIDNSSILREVSRYRCICWIYAKKRIFEWNRNLLMIFPRELSSSVTCRQ